MEILIALLILSLLLGGCFTAALLGVGLLAVVTILAVIGAVLGAVFGLLFSIPWGWIALLVLVFYLAGYTLQSLGNGIRGFINGFNGN